MQYLDLDILGAVHSWHHILADHSSGDALLSFFRLLKNRIKLESLRKINFKNQSYTLLLWYSFLLFFLNVILCFKSTNLEIKMADNDQKNTFLTTSKDNFHVIQFL